MLYSTLFVMLLPLPAFADDTDDAEIDELRERLRALEVQLDEFRLAQSSVDEAEVPLDLETQVHGFAAVKAGLYEDDPIGFGLDELVFTYAANLDRKYTFYSEIAFEPAEASVEVDVEAVTLSLKFTDRFGIDVGRVHAPQSWWATKAFHGSYRYLPVSTPEVLALEDHGGGYMPMHQTGVFAFGTVPMGLSRFLWTIGTSNGRSPLLGGIAQSGDSSWGKAVVTRLSVEAPSGLVVGLGGYYDTVNPGDSAEDLAGFGDVLPEPMHEAIGGYHAIYDTRSFYFASEAYVMSHKFADEDSGLSYGGYLLVGPRIGRTTPYLNIDFIELVKDSALVTAGATPEGERKAGLGVRHDFGMRIAFKAQFDAIEGRSYESILIDDQHAWGDLTSDFHYGIQTQLAAGF